MLFLIILRNHQMTVTTLLTVNNSNSDSQQFILIFPKRRLTHMQNQSQMSNNSSQRKPYIQQFYNQFGIKQYNSFSGGFRYHERAPVLQTEQQQRQQLSKDALYRQLGLSSKGKKLDMYKIDNEYVPETKNELADKLMEKIEHKMKKIKYYREKYCNNS